ncbi:hypothetical protein JTE90_007514 [Oedothorax gibbosus]|uniref:Uncharacterized protein n=1 Tax=Oedothorax gibbosus TaxID=931172 RepID=A0AAV6VNG2_9ARAC|nr:hypothetical protein JTE90_007514 [Oedothorax gibbosus]
MREKVFCVAEEIAKEAAIYFALSEILKTRGGNIMGINWKNEPSPKPHPFPNNQFPTLRQFPQSKLRVSQTASSTTSLDALIRELAGDIFQKRVWEERRGPTHAFSLDASIFISKTNGSEL